MLTSGVGLDGVAVAFDDERAVADAGLVPTATLAAGLGLETLGEQTVDLGRRPGAANAGAKVMTLVSAMALGADCIEDATSCAGRTGEVLGDAVAAPSTRGCFCVSRSGVYEAALDLTHIECRRRRKASSVGASGPLERSCEATSRRAPAGHASSGDLSDSFSLATDGRPPGEQVDAPIGDLLSGNER